MSIPWFTDSDGYAREIDALRAKRELLAAYPERGVRVSLKPPVGGRREWRVQWCDKKVGA